MAWEDVSSASPGQKSRPTTPKCYCGSRMVLRTGKYGFFYGCSRFPDCDGLIGCHKGTSKPIGTPANKEVRRARIQAHEAFDVLWKGAGRGYRSAAYRWLSEQIGVDEAHMGEMDLETAQLVVEICEGMGPEDLEEYLQDRES